MAKQSFGIVGLGVMGETLALNIESHDFSVTGFDLDGKKVDRFTARTRGKRAVATYQRVDRPGKVHTQWTEP